VERKMKKQLIWAVKESGRPEWDKYIGYTFNCIKNRIAALKRDNRPHEVITYLAGTEPKWTT